MLAAIGFQPLITTAQTSDTTGTDSVAPYVPTTRPSFNPTFRYNDPFSARANRSALYLNDPSTAEYEINYDSGFSYTYTERIGNVNLRPTSTITFEEYDRVNTENITREYFQERSAGLDGESAVSSRRLIPKLYISPIFDRIFGGTYVDIVPTGFVNLDFGGNWQRVENPAIPIRQQRNGGFVFDQQISLNLVGNVGEKLKITANFDNNNTFDFQNNMRIEYTGYEEEIIKKIEIGNVNMPVNNSLMTGAQTLFGLKTQLQFGKVYFTGVASRQQGQRRVATQSGTQNPQYGGELLPQNSIRSSEYDADKHFFLGHFFREHFEEWIEDPRNIISGLQIVNIEVYVTNRDQNTQNTLNTVALLDLGETQRAFNPVYQSNNPNLPTSNGNNLLYQNLINLGTRNSDNLVGLLENNLGLENGREFVATNITKQLQRGTEYVVNEQLGYITLLTNLFDNQSLAVAFQYSYNGQIFTVGELSAERRITDNQSLFLKMLRPANVATDLPTWDLMMKNIYNLNTTQLEQSGFELRVHYRDDLTNFDNPSLNESIIRDIPLVRVMGADQYNPNLDPGPDGLFDFIPGVTVNTQRGFIIFPVLEPFGQTLEDTLREEEFIERYVYNELYETTQGIAQRESEKDKYVLYYRARGAQGGFQNNEIQIDAFQITPGSITVRLGTTTLVEGRDYTVGFGKVTITNPNYLPNIDQIQVEYETPNLFNFQTTWFYGGRLDYQINDNFSVGATILHVNERRGGVTRFTVGNEPLRNTKYGFDVSIQEESRFLTKAVDALPLVSTKTPSTVTFSAEYARFIPGSSNDINGEPTSYIEDFETAATPTNLGGFQSWKLAATPRTADDRYFGNSDSVQFNYRKAKIAWYTIDNSVFYRTGGQRPENLSEEDLQNHYVRAVLPQEIFKQRDRTQVNLNEPLFDVAFFPSERGQLNFNPDLTDRSAAKSGTKLGRYHPAHPG